MMTKLVQEGGGDGGEALRGGPRSDATAALSLIGIFRIGRLEAITACFFQISGISLEVAES